MSDIPRYDLDSYDDDTPICGRSEHEEKVKDREADDDVKAVIA